MKTKPCPFCDETLPAVAVHCHTCGRDVPSPDNPVGGAYWQELLTSLQDFEIDEEELDRLKRVRKGEGLTDEQIRTFHAGAAVWLLGSCGEDGRIDEEERQRIRFVWTSLSLLGWAPGE